MAATAGYALGRLAMAVDRSPLRPLWTSHETARVVATLFSRGADPIGAETLLALGAGLPGDRGSITEAAAQRFWHQALQLWRPRVAADPQATIPEITNELAALARGDLAPGEMALEAPWRMAAATGWSLPPVALALPPSDTETGWEAAFIGGLVPAADESRERLEGLERDFRRWLERLPRARSDSRLRDALVLLGTMHALTPRYLGESLGLTRQAAARLLKRLERLGIVRQATRRKRWLVYLAENAAAGSAVPENTTETPGELDMAIGDIDRVLDDAYRALDRAMRRDDGHMQGRG